jgi:hypothetical protein
MGPVPAEETLFTICPYSSMADDSTSFTKLSFIGILQAGSPLKNFNCISLNPLLSGVPLKVGIVSEASYQVQV